MRSVRNAVFYSSVNKYIIKIIGFVSAVVTARLLTPEEVGVFAIGSALVIIVAQFQSMGGSGYLIREKSIDQKKIGSALGVSLLICWSIFLVLIGVSFFIEGIYGTEGLAVIFQLLSIPFLLSPFISVVTALLARNFGYRKIMTVQVSAAIFSFVSLVAFIKLDFSFYSLALAQITTSVIQLIVSVILAPREMVWLPNFVYFRELLKYGGVNSLAVSLTTAHASLADLIIGHQGTTRDVGLFSRGFGFINFLSGAVTEGLMPVALTFFSSLKSAGEDLAGAYSKATGLVGGFLWPVLCVCSISSSLIIEVVFGEKWIESSFVASFISIFFIIKTANIFFFQLLNSSGHEKWILCREIPVFLFLGIAIYFSYSAGINGVAISFVLSAFIDLIISFIIIRKLYSIRLLSYLIEIKISLVISLICLISAWILLEVFSGYGFRPWLQLLIISILLPLIWLLCILGLKHPLKYELGIIFDKIIPNRSMD